VGRADVSPDGTRHMDTRRIPGVEVCAGVPVVDSPVANMHSTELQMPLVGSAWTAENHSENKGRTNSTALCAPGSRFDIKGGFGLVVSQWHTAGGWPYRAMQFKPRSGTPPRRCIHRIRSNL